jgi:uncharacterized metal-binding protein YceD (DUF177 family)
LFIIAGFLIIFTFVALNFRGEMSAARDYTIHLGSLGSGEEEFEFHISDKFFQKFEQSIIEKGDVDILVVVEKKDNMILLDFTTSGEVTIPCDRCLQDLVMEIEGYNELIVKIGDHNEELSEDVIMISSKEHELDLSQYIYEFISLMIPMRNVHDESENGQACDPEVLKEIEKHVNHEQEPQSDPRWDGLKNINLN